MHIRHNSTPSALTLSSTASTHSAFSQYAPPNRSASQTTILQKIRNVRTFDELLNILHNYDPRKDLKPPIKLEDYSIVARKKIQSALFDRGLEKLSVEELKRLCIHMHRVQCGEIGDYRFDTIRRERSMPFGGGNTATWQRIFFSVKTELISRHPIAQKGTTEYAQLKFISSIHCGRWYARWGKTNSHKYFKMLMSSGDQGVEAVNMDETEEAALRNALQTLVRK